MQSSILCEKPGLGLSSDSVGMLSYLMETNMAAVFIHNPLPVQRSSYITVQLPNGLCTLVWSNYHLEQFIGTIVAKTTIVLGCIDLGYMARLMLSLAGSLRYSNSTCMRLIKQLKLTVQ